VLYRKLGKCELVVPVIGMGCWAIGGDSWGLVEEQDAIAAVRQALDRGTYLFDTADVYGHGRSEELLANALTGVPRSHLLLASKVGLWYGLQRPNRYTTPDLIVEHCNASLRRLRTDYLDLYYCHVFWNENTLVYAEAFDQLKIAGKIRFCGVSTNELATVQAFHQAGTCDVVQLEYNMLNRRPEQDLLPFCRQHEIGVVVREPLRRGLLTGKYDAQSVFSADDMRHGWPQEAWYLQSMTTVTRLKNILGDNHALNQVALAFCLHHPDVATVIPGAKNAHQMAANAAALDLRLSAQDWMAIFNALAM
jgi:myo-inositol catabolism protein IolS